MSNWKTMSDRACWGRGSLFGGLAYLAILASGCSDDDDELRGPDITTDAVYDPTIDFSQYQTFAFRDASDADQEMMDGLESDQVTLLDVVNRQVASELRELGLEQVPAEEADLLAFSLANTTARGALTWTCVAGGWGGYWYWGLSPLYDPCAWLEPVYMRVDSTTVMAGLVDPDREEVAFVGFVNGIDPAGGTRRQDVETGISRVFARYPARPSGGGAGADAGGGDAGGPDGGVPDGGGVPDAGAADAGALDAGATNSGDDDGLL